jgi:GT2 family glycosyltransferase
MEVIVVDDGSSDRTPEILRLLQDQGLGFTVIRQDNQGAAGCRDRGIKTATGEVIFIISQDTFAEKDWFTVVVAEFSRNPRLGIVQGRVALTEPIDCPFYHAVELNAFVWNFPTAAIAYRAEALDRAGRYFDSLFSEYGDDTDVAWRIIEHGYDYTWLDRLTACHGVYPKSFTYPLRRAFPGPVLFPLLVKRHPGIRHFLLHGFLWSAPQRLVSILLLLVGTGFTVSIPAVGTTAMALGVVLGLYRHRRAGSRELPWTQRYLVVPLNAYACDILGFLAMLYGSLKYRSLVL